MKGLSFLALVPLLAGSTLAQSHPDRLLNNNSIFVREGPGQGAPPALVSVPAPVFIGAFNGTYRPATRQLKRMNING